MNDEKNSQVNRCINGARLRPVNVIFSGPRGRLCWGMKNAAFARRCGHVDAWVLNESSLPPASTIYVVELGSRDDLSSKLGDWWLWRAEALTGC